MSSVGMVPMTISRPTAGVREPAAAAPDEADAASVAAGSV